MEKLVQRGIATILIGMAVIWITAAIVAVVFNMLS
jgi:hypothetical protein